MKSQGIKNMIVVRDSTIIIQHMVLKPYPKIHIWTWLISYLKTYRRISKCPIQWLTTMVDAMADKACNLKLGIVLKKGVGGA